LTCEVLTSPSVVDQAFWHSSAHVLGEALELEYGVDLTIGPALEEGFYYDCYLGERTLTDADKGVLEKRVEKIIKEGQKFERVEVSRAEALSMFEENKFKVRLGPQPPRTHTRVPALGMTAPAQQPLGGPFLAAGAVAPCAHSCSSGSSTIHSIACGRPPITPCRACRHARRPARALLRHACPGARHACSSATAGVCHWSLGRRQAKAGEAGTSLPAGPAPAAC
jgi:hypothetical protein